MADKYMLAAFLACAFITASAIYILVFPRQAAGYGYSFNLYSPAILFTLTVLLALTVLFAFLARWLSARRRRPRWTTTDSPHQDPAERESLLSTTEPHHWGTETVVDDETISDIATMRAQCGSPPGQRRSVQSLSSAPIVADTDSEMAGVGPDRTVPFDDSSSHDGQPDVLEGVIPTMGQKWDHRVKKMILNGRSEEELERDPSRDW